MIRLFTDVKIREFNRYFGKNIKEGHSSKVFEESYCVILFSSSAHTFNGALFRVS